MNYLHPDPKPEPRPPKARKPLRRSWMRKKAPRRLSRAGTDLAYLERVRGLPCHVANSECWGRIHAHHAIFRSQGGTDLDAVPLCLHHHACLHGASGPFAGLSRLERFAWAMMAIAATRVSLGVDVVEGSHLAGCSVRTKK